MADNTEGPELKVTYSADLDGLKKGNSEAKQEVKEYVQEVDKASDSNKKFGDSANKAGSSTKSHGDLIGKASAIAGGTFVTAALAVASAIGSANSQVNALNKSVQISSGSQQAYALNMASLTGIADKHRLSVFSLAEGFNELTRETRGTLNEGKPTAAMFDSLVNVSEKLGFSVTDTTGKLGGFIDKMKDGKVDSTGLSNELDKRLYEAFTKVATSMGITNDQLNEVLETSDEAVASILPALTEELDKALGEIPEQNARELGDSIAYVTGKSIELLDALADSSGTKSFLKQAADDAGDLLSQLALLAKERGVTSAFLGLMDAGAETLLNGTGFEGTTLKYARDRMQTPLIGRDFKLPGEMGRYSYEPDPRSAEKAKLLETVAENEEKAKEKAHRKALAEQKRRASEQKHALDAEAREAIEDSKRRIKEKEQAIDAALSAKYGKFNSPIGAIRELDKTGLTPSYDNGLKRKVEFTNETTGDGSALNFDHIIAGMDGVIAKVQAAYNRMQTAVTAEFVDSVAQLNSDIGAILSSTAANAAITLGETIGEALATGGENLKDAGKKFGLLIGNMLQDLGKALITFATLVTISESVFSQPAVALAVGVAAVAAGAYLKSKMSESEQRLWTGGIVQGQAGIDNVPVMLTAGEGVITAPQQNKLFSWLNGTYNGNDLGAGRASSASDRGQQFAGRLTVELSGSTLAFAADIGSRDNEYFR